MRNEYLFLRIRKVGNNWLLNYTSLGVGGLGIEFLVDRDKIHPDDHKLCEVVATILIELKKEGVI